MLPDRENHNTGRGYLRALLNDGARAFQFRDGWRRLLSAPAHTGLRHAYARHYFPLSFQYLRHPAYGVTPLAMNPGVPLTRSAGIEIRGLPNTAMPRSQTYAPGLDHVDSDHASPVEERNDHAPLPGAGDQDKSAFAGAPVRPDITQMIQRYRQQVKSQIDAAQDTSSPNRSGDKSALGHQTAFNANEGPVSPLTERSRLLSSLAQQLEAENFPSAKEVASTDVSVMRTMRIPSSEMIPNPVQASETYVLPDSVRLAVPASNRPGKGIERANPKSSTGTSSEGYSSSVLLQTLGQSNLPVVGRKPALPSASAIGWNSLRVQQESSNWRQRLQPRPLITAQDEASKPAGHAQTRPAKMPAQPSRPPRRSTRKAATQPRVASSAFWERSYLANTELRLLK